MAGITCSAQVFGTLGVSANWYLDGVNGSDSNNCTAAATACATVAHLLAQPISANQVVGVACNASKYREQFNVPASGVQVVGYGNCIAANYPLFDASDSIPGVSWSKTAGLTNTYQATVSPAVSLDGKQFVAVWENSVNLIYQTSTAAVDATPGSYFPSSLTVAPLTLYVHATDGGNPATNGSTYEINNRLFGVESYNFNNVRLVNLAAQRNLHNDGSIRLGKFGIASNVIAYAGQKHSILSRAGTYHYNVQALGAYFPATLGNLSLFIFNENTPNLEGITYDGCNADRQSTPGTNDSGYFGHVNTSGNFGVVRFLNSSAENTDFGFGTGTTTANIAYNLTADRTNNAGVQTGGGMWHIANSHLMGVTRSVVMFGSANITNTTLTGPSGVGSIYMAISGLSLSVAGSTFTSAVGIYSAQGATSTIYSHNNNFTGTGTQFYQFPTASLPAIDSDGNAFAPSGAFAVVNGIVYTLPQWRTLSGQDAHSTP